MSAAAAPPAVSNLPDAATIIQNYEGVKDRIQQTTTAANRSTDSVQLVAVSKTKPAEALRVLYDGGHRVFGENYFQELVEKAELLPTDIQWHFIGHLQSSKASKLVRSVPNLAVVETVDSIGLATKLHNACDSSGREAPLEVYIQVKTSDEESKSGVSGGSELAQLVRDIVQQCPKLRVTGLMTIGAPNDVTCFDQLVSIRSSLITDMQAAATPTCPMPTVFKLSMGMSGDFEEAIRRGSDVVRVGSSLFGARSYPAKPAAADVVEGGK